MQRSSFSELLLREAGELSAAAEVLTEAERDALGSDFARTDIEAA